MSNNSFRKLIHSRINREELINKPELSNALEKDKIIRLDFLSTVKPKFIDTKGFKNEKKKNMVEDINSFKQIYYKDYLINKNSLEKIYKISNENNKFLNHFSGFNKYYNNKNQKEILNEIQLEYKKKLGFSPTLKENGNLFSNSILLQNDKDLKQYISLDLDTTQKDNSSLSFLKNVRNKIKLSNSKGNNFLEKLKNEEFNNNEDDAINLRNYGKKYKSAMVERERYESINELKRDINKAKECFNSIDNLNYFLNSNPNNRNKRYLSSIGNIKSRKSSGDATTRMSSGVKNLNKLKINDFYGITKKNNPDIINKANNIPNKTDKTENNEHINKNNNSIILPPITINNNISYKSGKNNGKEEIKDYIKINEPNKLEIKKEKNKINSIKRNSNKKKVKNRKIVLRKPSMGLEKLYETISKTENFIEYNKEIKNYLKQNNYDIKDKINSDELYQSVDQSRRKITDISSIQKNYEMMVNNKLKSFEQNNEIIQNNKKIKQNIENIEERMIDLLCDVNNQYEDN